MYGGKRNGVDRVRTDHLKRNIILNNIMFFSGKNQNLNMHIKTKHLCLAWKMYWYHFFMCLAYFSYWFGVVGERCFLGLMEELHHIIYKDFSYSHILSLHPSLPADTGPLIFVSGKINFFFGNSCISRSLFIWISYIYAV